MASNCNFEKKSVLPLSFESGIADNTRDKGNTSKFSIQNNVRTMSKQLNGTLDQFLGSKPPKLNITQAGQNSIS